MFDKVVHNAKQAAARTVRKTVIGLGAGLCLLAGAAFLTLAAWLFLITVTTTLNAALIIGGTYFGLGLILVGVASADSSSDRQESQSAQQDSNDHVVPKLIAAFMTGLQAGRSTRG